MSSNTNVIILLSQSGYRSEARPCAAYSLLIIPNGKIGGKHKEVMPHLPSNCTVGWKRTDTFSRFDISLPSTEVGYALLTTNYPQATLERETGIEPATFSLARRCSTTEPLPHARLFHCHTLKQSLVRSLDWFSHQQRKWAVRDSNSHDFWSTDPKSALSTNFSNRPDLRLRIATYGIKTSLQDDTSRYLSLSSQFFA